MNKSITEIIFNNYTHTNTRPKLQFKLNSKLNFYWKLFRYKLSVCTRPHSVYRIDIGVVGVVSDGTAPYPFFILFHRSREITGNYYELSWKNAINFSSSLTITEILYTEVVFRPPKTNDKNNTQMQLRERETSRLFSFNFTTIKSPTHHSNSTEIVSSAERGRANYFIRGWISFVRVLQVPCWIGTPHRRNLGMRIPFPNNGYSSANLITLSTQWNITLRTRDHENCIIEVIALVKITLTRLRLVELEFMGSNEQQRIRVLIWNVSDPVIKNN